MAEVVGSRVVNAPPRRVAEVLSAASGWLDQVAPAAEERTRGMVATIWADLGLPGGMQVGKQIRFEVGPAHQLRDRTVVPVWWEAAGFPALFPVMDAIVELRPEGTDGTRVVFWGRYDPPLGRAGDLLDRFVAHRVAEATVEELLSSLGERAEVVIAS